MAVNINGSLKDRAKRSDIHKLIEDDRISVCGEEPKNLQVYREYAAGKQAMPLDGEDYAEFLRGLLEDGFCDNICHPVLAEASNRFDLERFTCQSEAEQAWLDKFYIYNEVADMQGPLHYDMKCDGDIVVALGWDKKKKWPTTTTEKWWDGGCGIYIKYLYDGTRDYIVKEWDTYEGVRRNVWYDDRLERWISPKPPNTVSTAQNPTTGIGGGMYPAIENWVPYLIDGPEADNAAWPRNWTLGHMPFVHFANKTRGHGFYGISDLAGGVIGFQNQLNSLHFDMSAAGRMTGFQMIWIAGIANTVTTDSNGNKRESKPRVAPGNILTSTNPDTKFGTIPPGPLTEIINLYKLKLERVAYMTSTPYHAISGGDWPSGEGILRAERPAVEKAYRQMKNLRVSWIEVAHRAMELYNARSGKPKLDEDEIIEAQFASPERRDPLSKSVIVANLSGKISKREGLRIMEYSEADAEKVYKESVEEETASAEILAASKPDPATGNNKNPTKLNAQRQPSNLNDGNKKKPPTGGGQQK